MFKQTREKDLSLFVNMANMDKPKNREDIPTTVLIPAFVISELKTAFIIGFVLYVPFLVIDMVVASVLLSMGMMMLPPIMVSLPFKLMLFVLVDGWNLIVGSLVKSFMGG
jgi:flagellar biosynthetic protein FliP